MKICKADWDKYVAVKKDLIDLEREAEFLEERMLVARKAVFAFESCGLTYDVEGGHICCPVNGGVVRESALQMPITDTFDPF